MKQFLIDNTLQTFLPIKDFRAQYHLPDTFGMALFQPKDYTGLGSLDHAGAALQTLHHTILAAIPAQTPAQGWTAFTLQLQLIFRRALMSANPQIGLHPTEVDYAVAGFSEVCQMFLYALRQAQMQAQPLPSFSKVYHGWLFRSLEVSQTVFPYTWQDETWQIQLIRHIYGRVGMKIQRGDTVHYVYDAALACPAEGFMAALLSDVAAQLSTAFTHKEYL